MTDQPEQEQSIRDAETNTILCIGVPAWYGSRLPHQLFTLLAPDLIVIANPSSTFSLAMRTACGKTIPWKILRGTDLLPAITAAYVFLVKDYDHLKADLPYVETFLARVRSQQQREQREIPIVYVYPWLQVTDDRDYPLLRQGASPVTVSDLSKIAPDDRLRIYRERKAAGELPTPAYAPAKRIRQGKRSWTA